MWTVKMHATGHLIPAAVAAAQRTRFVLEQIAADMAPRLQAEAEARGEATGAETAVQAAAE